MATKNTAGAMPAKDAAAAKAGELDFIYTQVKNLRTDLNRFHGKLPKSSGKRIHMGNAGMPFTQKSLEFASEHPESVSQSMDMETFKRFTPLFMEVVKLETSLNQAAAELREIKAVIGDAAFREALKHYKNVRLLARDNLAGMKEIHDQLKFRYPRRKGKNASETAAAEDTMLSPLSTTTV
jgi:hypothetical protein